MKITKQSISEKDGAGSATLRPEYPEDLWHAYNLIAVGDSVRADTVRKVQTHNSTTVACGHSDSRSCRRLNWQALDVAAVCSCARQVKNMGATGSTKSDRKRTTLCVQVPLHKQAVRVSSYLQTLSVALHAKSG